MSSRNKRHGEKVTHKLSTWILNGLLAAAVVFFIIACAVFAEGERDAKNTEYNVTSLQYDIKDSRYYNLPRKTSANRVNGVGKGNNQYEECYAAADYFYAAVVGRMYGDDAALAEYYEAKKNSAKEKLGLYAAEADRIDGMIDAFINKN